MATFTKCVSIHGVKADGCVVAGERFVEPIQVVNDPCVVYVNLSEIGFDRDRFFKKLLGFSQVSQRVRDKGR